MTRGLPPLAALGEGGYHTNEGELQAQPNPNSSRLSLPDLVLAAKIDAIEIECSPKWLKEQAAAAAAH